MTDNDRNAPRPERPASEEKDPLLELTRLFNLDFNANGDSPTRKPVTSTVQTGPSEHPQNSGADDAGLSFLDAQPPVTSSRPASGLTNDRNTAARNNDDLDFLPQAEDSAPAPRQQEPDLPFNELYDMPSFTPQARATGAPIEPPAGFPDIDLDTLPDLPIGNEPSQPVNPVNPTFDKQAQYGRVANSPDFVPEQTTSGFQNTRFGQPLNSPNELSQPVPVHNFSQELPEQNTNDQTTVQQTARRDPIFDEMGFDKELENLLVNDPLPASGEHFGSQNAAENLAPSTSHYNDPVRQAVNPPVENHQYSGDLNSLPNIETSGNDPQFQTHRSQFEQNKPYSANTYSESRATNAAPLPYEPPQQNQTGSETDFLNSDDPFGFDDVFANDGHPLRENVPPDSGLHHAEPAAAPDARPQSADPFGLEDLSADENAIVNPPFHEAPSPVASPESRDVQPDMVNDVADIPHLPLEAQETEQQFMQSVNSETRYAQTGEQATENTQALNPNPDYPQPAEENDGVNASYPASEEAFAQNSGENDANQPPDVNTYKFADEIVETTEPVDVPEIPYPAEEPAQSADALESEFADVFSVGNKQEATNTPQEQDDFFAEAYAQSGYGQDKTREPENASETLQGQYPLPQPNVPYDGSEQALLAGNAALEGLQNQNRPKSFARKLTIGGVALFILLGGGYAAMKYFMPSQGGGASTVIHADDSPYKVQAEQTGTTNETQNNQDVYNQANGQNGSEGNQDKLVDHSETPEDLTALNDVPDGVDTYADPSNVEDAITAASNQSVPTREVQSVVVNPDGTITPSPRSNTAEKQDSSSATINDKEANAQNGTEQASSDGTASSESGMSAADSELTKIINEDAQSNHGTPDDNGDNSQTGSLTSESVLNGINTVNSPKRQQQAQPIITAETPRQSPPALPKTPTRPLETSEPKTTAPVTASVGSGGYYVQIASQPTQEAATTSMNKAKSLFGSLIGSLPLSIQPASIPGKGTYYRVRIQVGPRDDAVSLCDKIKSQNGSCFVGK